MLSYGHRNAFRRGKFAGMQNADIVIAVFAHNEAGRIARCIQSLPLGQVGVSIHVIVNGSSDATAAIARVFAETHANLVIHDWPEGGKARSWNRFIFEVLGDFAPVHVFVDGDAEVLPGSIAALYRTLALDGYAQAASALPMNGRLGRVYRRRLTREHGLFGDLYALRGAFLARMKEAGARLPEDLVGDDGLVAALAKCDLGNEEGWDDARVAVCATAGFLCEPVRIGRPASWLMQLRRMRNYSQRHFQNLMISTIMERHGPAGLPSSLASIYSRHLPSMRPRRHPALWWFDRQALKHMRREAEAAERAARWSRDDPSSAGFWAASRRMLPLGFVAALSLVVVD
jgi:glycosyltransferase involved in cell wall biosynthesis